DKSKDTFTITLPPPNVTGKLHLGHAWDTTIQDMIIRRKRMQGFDTLWIPGMDHAGIATQAKVDALLKSEGISRFDIGREEFLKRSFMWKDEYSGHIREQWGALGLSLDYSKERFTLDEQSNKAVNHVFIELYKKGYIYQGKKVINWDSDAKTALSNIEVDYKDIEGAFYHFKYMIEGTTEFLQVATTRPETMFADKAVMVHPKDKRYTKYVGKYALIPGTDIKIPVITDDYVDMEFGTGCVKVTPAHDPNDYEVGIRHKLDMPLCMNEDGTMNELTGKYNSMDRFACRKQLVKDLENLDLVVKIEKIVHSVGHSERTGAVVEPRLSKQWFVNMEVLSKQVLENKEYSFVPERFKTNLVRWLENIQDWCISRQLWWGHRIPAWYKDDKVVIQETSPGEGYIQDEDVLDTWFSSALWPFSTLGFPNKTDDLKRYYPNNVLVTGYDIIFFWVSRMLFQGIEFLGKAPFKEILIHGLIRDKDGKKMSKSLGNGVDPFDVINKYGCDSLRYFLNTNAAPGQDLRFDETKVESSWNYINKIWNISRFVLMNLTDYKKDKIDTKKLDLSSKWILSKLNNVIKEVDTNFEKYEFGEVARSLYNFVYDDFASWYVELSKIDIANTIQKNTTLNVLVYVLESILKMLHPIIPFVTEEIYSHINESNKSIMVSDWPTYNKDYVFKDEEKQMNIIIELITSLRNERSKANKAPSAKLNITLYSTDKAILSMLKDNDKYLTKFLNTEELVITDKKVEGTDFVIVVLNQITMYIPTSELINLEEVILKLESELSKLEKEVIRSKNMLSNEAFVSKAPKEKLEIEKNKLLDYEKRYSEVKQHLSKLK
ncbi:MAG: valine--tRNA ligase, partial [Anaeroplasmataceae bacterium]